MDFFRIYKNVSIGSDCIIGDFSTIGIPPRDYEDGELATVLGSRVEIASHALISAGNFFGDDCSVGHGTFMRHNNRFGNRVRIGDHNTIEWNNIVEDDVVIEEFSGVAESSIVEQGSWIGPQCSMASVLHPLCPKAKECTKGPHLYRGVTVGAGGIIFPDIRIGEGAYIEPGTVVMSDVLPYTVVSGAYGKLKGDVFTLYPQLLERIQPYVDLSSNVIAKVRHDFSEQPSRFPNK
jgi:acetyltransferase-like isoleucine patch superfamily enzyme